MQTTKRPRVLQAGEGMKLHVMDVLFNYKVTSQDTDGLYALAEGVVPAQRGVPLHTHHREDEAFYILEGEFEIECNGEKFRATAGAFALLPKHLPHRFTNLLDTPGRLLCVQSPGGVEEFFAHLAVLAQNGPPDAKKVKELTQRYDIEFPRRPPEM